jgi:hypothetical protein
MAPILIRAPLVTTPVVAALDVIGAAFEPFETPAVNLAHPSLALILSAHFRLVPAP